LWTRLQRPRPVGRKQKPADWPEHGESKEVTVGLLCFVLSFSFGGTVVTECCRAGGIKLLVWSGFFRRLSYSGARVFLFIFALKSCLNMASIIKLTRKQNNFKNCKIFGETYSSINTNRLCNLHIFYFLFVVKLENCVNPHQTHVWLGRYRLFPRLRVLSLRHVPRRGGNVARRFLLNPTALSTPYSFTFGRDLGL
jgi:hypothetical protein